jgi:hypothetical protein
LLAEAGFILEPNLDLLVWMLLGDLLDLLQGVFFKSFLGRRIRLVMARLGHQATVAQPVQQIVQPRQAVEFAKLLLNPGSQILGPPHAGVRVLGLLVQVVLDLLLLGIVQPALVATAAAVGESSHSLGVVLTHPMLDLPPREAQQLADLGSGLTLLGQPDDLHAYQETGISLLTDQTLEFFGAVMLCHMHGSPPCEKPACHTHQAGATLTRAKPRAKFNHGPYHWSLGLLFSQSLCRWRFELGAEVDPINEMVIHRPSEHAHGPTDPVLERDETGVLARGSVLDRFSRNAAKSRDARLPTIVGLPK